MNDLWAALSLVAIIEGLFLFIAPGGWKRSAEQLHAMTDTNLRTVGGVILIIGIIALYLIRY